MSKKCECNHKCRCGDVWACILKPAKYLFFVWLALSCIGEINRNPRDFIELLIWVACALGALIVVCGIAAVWSVAKAFREMKTTPDGSQQ